MSASRHFPPQALQHLRSVRKWPSRDHRRREAETRPPDRGVQCSDCCATDAERRPVKQARHRDDSSDDEDDGEDDDMDGFIDDGSDAEGNDYSHYIRELFGYDRRKSVILL